MSPNSEPSLTSRLNSGYSGAIYDVMCAMGRTKCVLPHQITGLDLDTRCCRPVFTLRGDAFDAKRADEETDYLLPWVEFLAVADKIVTEVENVIATGDRVHSAILSGIDSVDAYLKHRKF